ALVRMVVVYGQRSAAGEPEDLAALHLDRRRERHEHALVVVRVVDDFQMVAALRPRGRGGEGEGERAECKGGERGGRANGFLGVHGESSMGPPTSLVLTTSGSGTRKFTILPSTTASSASAPLAEAIGTFAPNPSVL